MSDFYFPFVWLGLILVLDGAIELQWSQSPLTRHPRQFLALFLLSIGFWWLFELLDVAVGNWRYVGAERYTGPGFVAFASLDFSLVVPAVWEAATVVWLLLPRSGQAPPARKRPPHILLVTSVIAGVVSLVLPVAFPRIFYGLIWGALFLVLDPVNAWQGRPSLWVAVWRREWRLPISFALGALGCGFFWEAWNQWAMPKWEYVIPYVGFWHIFQMPLLGWFGYLPFGLELYAMTNAALPLLRLAPLPFPDQRIRAASPAISACFATEPARSRAGP